MRVGLLFNVMLILLISCQKTPPGDILPPPSNTGEHTLGFFVNGEAWIPYDRGNHEVHELPKAKLTRDGSLKISATKVNDRLGCRHWFCIEIEQKCHGPGKYDLSNVECNSPYQTFYYGENRDKPGEVYELVPGQSHYIEITHLDHRKKIVSGLFQFDAVSEFEDTLRVRSGRFDLNFE